VNILIEQTVAAGATVNIMTGQQYEFLPFDANVQIGLAGSATGLVATVFAGPDLIQQEGPVLVLTTFPSIQDQLYIDELIAGGTRVSINVRNTTGGVLTVRAVIRILPLQ
jgi:hypothetical protein